MANSYALHEAGTAVADGTGKAIVTLRPLRAFEIWKTTNIAIFSSSITNIPTFKVYRGSEAPTNLLGGTYKGTINSDSSFSYILQNGEGLVGVWEGADVGASCTMSVDGSREGR